MVEGVTWWLEILQNLFGSEVVGWIVLILSPFIFIYSLLWLIQAIIELVKTKLIPLLYNSEEKQKIRLRKRFADHIESEIRRLNQREDWNDFRFAELEAEVEMEGKRRSFSLLPFVNRTSNGLRREKSLAKALKQSRERIILVEGDPGSGKSVALRHVALEVAKGSAKSNDLASIIPVYLNLKELRRETNQAVDRRLIEDFILNSLKRINDRDVNKFVDEEFYSGLKNGTWFFLFDSFDEIPDILGAEDADKIIREYADAIYDFLHGLNACRGVVASRYFKGPGQVDWTRFKIINLTKSRQIKLVKLSELKPHHEKVLLGNLDGANSDIKKFSENPLFLGLLAGYVQEHEDFPQHVDAVFGSYIKHRISQDKDRVQQRFRLDVEKIHLVAEKVAFCMSQSNNLGLSPSRRILKKSLLELEIDLQDGFENSLDALEFMKLARSDNSDMSGDDRTFTFSHRRFQEYFATLYVLRERKISIEELLRNPRWRETIVVIFQTQPLEIISPYIEAASALLSSYFREIYPTIESMSEDGKDYPIDFPWPTGYLYLLDLLQDGFSNRKNILPDELRESVGAILNLATLVGSLPNRIWALEVAGIAPTATLLEIIRPAISAKSHFLSDLAYRQVSRLDEIPEDISIWIKKSVLKKLLQLGVFQGENVVYAQVSRLINSKKYIAVVRGVQFGYWIDIINSLVISTLLFVSAYTLPTSIVNFNTDIPWRFVLIVFGALTLITPWTVYGEEQINLFHMNRFMYMGVVLSLFVPFIFAYKLDSLYLLIPLYFSFVFPSVIAVAQNISANNTFVFVLFSPVLIFGKLLREMWNGLSSIKLVKLPQQSRSDFLIVLIATFILCLIPTVSRIVFNSDTGMIIFSVILLSIIIFAGYIGFKKIFLRDRKHRKAWKEWMDFPRNEVNIIEILRVLPIISIEHAHILFEKIREEKLFVYSQENLQFLSEMVRLVENPDIDNEFSDALQDFLMYVGENRLTSLLLDELYISIKEMKYKIQ